MAKLFPSFVLSAFYIPLTHEDRITIVSDSGWLRLSLAAQDLPQYAHLLRSSTYCPVEYGVGVRRHFSATEAGGKYTGCPQEAAAAVTSERGPNGTRLCPASDLLCGLADLSPTSPLLG